MAIGTEYRTLSREYEVTVLCFVAVFDLWLEVVLWLQAFDLIALIPIVALIPLVLTGGKLIVLYGLTNAQSWGYRWALGVYASGLLFDLGTIHVTGMVFNAVILVWLVNEADYFR